MMIHLIDNDTKETFKSFGDNEVQPAIAAARASGKIVNMDLDENNEHCQIFITRDSEKESPTILSVNSADFGRMITETAEVITEMGNLITDTLKKAIPPFCDAFVETVNHIRPFLDAVGEMAAFGEIRTPEEIKKEIKHTKNPMRLSQLYKELDASYKEFKRLKGRSNGE